MKKMHKSRMKVVIALMVAVMLVFPVVAVPLTISAEDYASNFAGGKGSENDPYLISTKEQFDKLRTFHSGAHYRLINDITFELSDFEEGGMYYNDGMGWLPIETPFSGTLDGNGYGIYGLSTNVSYEGGSAAVGLFAQNVGTIVNLSIVSTIWVDNWTEGADYYTAVGSICGRNEESGKIINCSSMGSLAAYGEHIVSVGGLAGVNFGKIENCKNTAMIDAFTDNYIAVAGGIAGIGYSRIKNCANDGWVMGYGNYEASQVFLGGIVGIGYEGAEIDHSYNTGRVLSNYDETGETKMNSASVCGGIVGMSNAEVFGCYNKGEVKGTSYGYGCVTGGIVGMSVEPVVSCYNQGEVGNTVTETESLIVGGVIGICRGRMVNCYNCGEVKGGYYIGGLAGAHTARDISYCYNIGMVYPIYNGNELCAGWLVGEIDGGTIGNSYYCSDLPSGNSINAVGKGVSGAVFALPKSLMTNLNSFSVFSKGDWLIDSTSDYPYPTIQTIEYTRLATGITVTKMPDKTQYDLNEYFSNAGMVVTLNYEDGTSVPISEYRWNNFDSSTPGDKKVRITYNYFSTEITVTVAHPEPTGIEIKTLPGRVNYPLGADFSNEGMWVVCSYSIGPAERITDYEVSGYDPNKLGEQTLTVTYKGFTDTFTVTVFDPENVSVIKGDTDFDLDVDSDDAIYLLYHVLFGEENYKLYQECNFDGQGGVDSDDAIHLLYHVLFGSEGYPLN